MTSQNTIFWNVDTQHDFMRPDGKLYVKGAEAIEPNLERLTQYARTNGIYVVNTADWHTPESEELSATPDYKTTFPPHCMADTKGAEFVPATSSSGYAIHWRAKEVSAKLFDNPHDITILKDDFDVFKGNPHTEEILGIVAPDRAIVYGVATNVCVDYAVKGLRKRGIETYVVFDAIKELPDIPVQPVYDSWRKSDVGFVVTEDVPKLLGHEPGMPRYVITTPYPTTEQVAKTLGASDEEVREAIAIVERSIGATKQRRRR
ncbi:TPA: cysteine hydrolase [Candidatus Woesearchaeota archaeon]|nr:cysteine hydrolase [Candidatus Woesearchaeota archaeon]